MSNEPDSAPNSAQIDYWNAAAGQTWAEYQEQLDRQIEPLGQEAMRVLAPAPGEHILDIGCGCGQTTLALAARVGPQGAIVGVDISAPMLDVARRRALSQPNVSIAFKELDAQVGALGAEVFDAAFSRFGVMFFSDPAAAFSNIHRSLQPGGRLTFVCWRPMQQNEWMRAPLEAAQPFLPPSAPADPLAPGPFAFADADRVRALLLAAGFDSVRVDPFDALIGAGSFDESLNLAFKVGPLGAALREHPECKDQVVSAVSDVLARHVTPAGVRMHSAVWIFLARKRR